MSASSQNNGKKSSNSSVVNTPASTPITNIANGNTQVNSQNSPPPNNNAPKYGTLVPNRIFVGGISANTTEGELLQLFSNYGTVKAAKIIQDRAGVSKGYGFITFESEDDARRPLREAENIVLRERKLNIAPAIKKQPFSRAFDASSPPAVAAGNPAQFFFPPGAAVPYFQGGVAYYPQPTPPAPGDPTTQQPVYQPPVYPAQTGPQQTGYHPSQMMYPTQTFYLPQQYPMHMPYEFNYYQNGGGPAQYMVSGQGGPGPQCPPMQPSNSPPRPPCYNQQMPYNPADSMFYNLPMYGTSMEGTPIYSEGFDGGPYSEDPYNVVDNTSQDLETSVVPAALTAIEHNHQHQHQQQPPQPNDVNEQKTSSPSLTTAIQQQNENTQIQSDTTRNSSTPVVSLLSIDHQQEKDYMSMQGGRRRKSNPMPPTSNVQQPHSYQSNGFVNSYTYSNSYAYPYNGVHNNFNNQIPVLHPDVYRYGNRNMMNGYDRSKKRRNFNDRRSNDHSSRSSLRTDSNSSASVVDENKNEEKTLRTNVNSPPPAPYSPMTNQGNYKVGDGTRNYQNSIRPNRNNYTNNDRRTVNKNPKLNLTQINTRQDVVPDIKAREHINSDYKITNNFNSSQQVHTSNQNFVPPARRSSRKSIRRSTSGGVNEIGAGDAPLPNTEVAETVKKMDSLKL